VYSDILFFRLRLSDQIEQSQGRNQLLARILAHALRHRLNEKESALFKL
jgi:predicted kinase